MSKTPITPTLWSDRPVDETIEVYSQWAQSYDQDVTTRGYHTPNRIAQALLPFYQGGAVLDFGCGTGISGLALKSAGITPLHGTDITPEMLDLAKDKGIYDKLWLGTAGAQPAQPGDYAVIVATGVISLGAAPPETLDNLVHSLAPKGLIALSFNDPTLEDPRYDAQLKFHVDAGALKMLFRQHGPHLSEMDMGSDVLVLERL